MSSSDPKLQKSPNDENDRYNTKNKSYLIRYGKHKTTLFLYYQNTLKNVLAQKPDSLYYSGNGKYRVCL